MFFILLFKIIIAQNTDEIDEIEFEVVEILSSACRCSQILSKTDCDQFCFWQTNNKDNTGYCRDKLCIDYDKNSTACNEDKKNLCYFNKEENLCKNLRGNCEDFITQEECLVKSNCKWNETANIENDETKCQIDIIEQDPINVICFDIGQEEICNESVESNSGYYCAWIPNPIPEDVDETAIDANQTNSTNTSGRILKTDNTGMCTRFSITQCEDVDNIDADDSTKKMLCERISDTCRYTITIEDSSTVDKTTFQTVSYSCQQKSCTDYDTKQLCMDNYKVLDYGDFLHLCNWTSTVNDTVGDCQEGLVIEKFSRFNSSYCYHEDTLFQLTWDQTNNRCTKCPGLSQLLTAIIKVIKTPELSDIEDDTIQQSIQFLYISPNLMLNLWPSIKKSLQNLIKAQNITPFQIQQEIESIYCLHFQNQHIKSKINFHNFVKALENFPLKKEFLTKIPQLAELALKIDTEFNDYIPMVNEEVTFTRRQIAILIINMFFCTTHLQPDYKLLPSIFLMAKLFNRSEDPIQNNKKIQKIKCLIYYLIYITSNEFKSDERIRIIRKKSKINFTSSKQLCDLVYCEYGQMENVQDSYIVDFANKKIGGGVLDLGCVQEEILFLTHPECLATLLITIEMKQDETIIIENVNRLIDYSGYKDKFECHGLLKTISHVNFICMDAQDYSGRSHYQYQDHKRELIKAHCGFNGIKSICTGKWGCGVFAGEWQLKLLIQWVAASLGGCQELIFINDESYAYNQGISQLKQLSANQLWDLIQKYCQQKQRELQMDAIQYILTCL